MTQPPSRLEGLRIERNDKPSARSPLLPFLIGIAAVVAIAIAFWLYAHNRAINVHTVPVRATAVSADRTVLNASGYVTARREATVSSKVTGKVDAVLIEEGMKVTEGQILARLDDTNVRASVQLARAQADSAKVALGETRVRLREAEQELRRQSDLRQSNVAAQADFDHAEAAALALRARLEQQQADVAVAERTVGVWQQQLDDTVIRAPFGGTVTSKNAQPGEMISPMSTGGFTRTGICTIVDMQSLEIEIDVNESYINRVSPEQSVEATLDAYPDWRIPCHVIAIIPTADRNKSTVRVRVGFDKLDSRILPDMSVKVGFRDTDKPAANAPPFVIVPKSAVRSDGGRTVVFVAQDGRAERRAISIAHTQGEEATVASGLASGERVIVNPPENLTDGVPVREISP